MEKKQKNPSEYPEESFANTVFGNWEEEMEDRGIEYYFDVLTERGERHRKNLRNLKKRGWYYPDEDEPLEGFHIAKSENDK